MGLIAPRTDSIDIIAMRPVKKSIGINPMSLCAPWAKSTDIIALNQVKK